MITVSTTALHLLRLLHLLLAMTVMVVGLAQTILSATQGAAALAQPQSSAQHRLSQRVLASVARAIVRFASRVGAVLHSVSCQWWPTRTHWEAVIEHDATHNSDDEIINIFQVEWASLGRSLRDSTRHLI